MHKARIYVDGKGYQGVDPDTFEPAQNDGLSNSFRNYNSDALEALRFGDEAIEIASHINIKSHVERILTRLRKGTLKASRIIIELEEYEL